MKKKKKPEQFIRRTSYPGGKKALDSFVKENMKYPKPALENKTSGTVKVKFDIDHKGKTSNAKVESGIGDGCDEEALRLIGLLKFKSIKHRGVRVTFHKTLDIHFRLPEKNKALKVSYTIKSASQNALPTKKAPAVKINYVIKKK